MKLIFTILSLIVLSNAGTICYSKASQINEGCEPQTKSYQFSQSVRNEITLHYDKIVIHHEHGDREELLSEILDSKWPKNRKYTLDFAEVEVIIADIHRRKLDNKILSTHYFLIFENRNSRMKAQVRIKSNIQPGPDETSKRSSDMIYDFERGPRLETLECKL